MQPFLVIDGLTAAYGEAAPVLDRVSLDVERGEMVALLGSSGCGKTTLLRAIAGFVVPRSGSDPHRRHGTSARCRRRSAAPR